MATFNTSKGNSVPHCHVPIYPCNPVDVTPAEIQEAIDWLAINHPGAVVIHPATYKYNCHGYAYTGSHGWFSFPELFMQDDYSEVSFDRPRVGDVVIYMKDGEITHSAVVKIVRNHQIKRLRSKWGVMPAVVHDLHDVQPGYGQPVRVMRRRPRPRNRNRKPN